MCGQVDARERTGALIRSGVPSAEILNSTLTRKAAGELSQRVQAAPGARQLRALAFHALGASICRREHRRFGRQATFAIRDAEEAEVEFGTVLVIAMEEVRWQPDPFRSR